MIKLKIIFKHIIIKKTIQIQRIILILNRINSLKINNIFLYNNWKSLLKYIQLEKNSLIKYIHTLNNINLNIISIIINKKSINL